MSPDDQAVALVTMVRGNTMVLVFASRQNLFLVVSLSLSLHWLGALSFTASLCPLSVLTQYLEAGSHETLVKISRC